MGDPFSSLGVSSSGLAAERTRLEVVANNIANAHSTRTPDGGPFRRQEVVFATVEGADGAHGKGGPKLGGVSVESIEDDPSDFQRVYDPAHPDADGDGYVSMPNVQLPLEMVNMITASRAYEANLRAMQTFRQLAEQTLTLLRANST